MISKIVQKHPIQISKKKILKVATNTTDQEWDIFFLLQIVNDLCLDGSTREHETEQCLEPCVSDGTDSTHMNTITTASLVNRITAETQLKRTQKDHGVIHQKLNRNGIIVSFQNAVWGCT